MEATTLPSPIFDGTRQEPSEGFSVPVAPKTKTPMSHQAAAIETTLQHRRVLVGMPAGTGKSLVGMSVAAAEVASRGARVLCLVPPSLLVSPWKQEFELDFEHLDLEMVTTGKTAPIRRDADVVIMSDAVLAKRLDDAIDWKPDVVIGDEAHRYKNQDSKRTKAVIQLCDSLDEDAVVAMMTGTLADNNIGDVYTPLRATGEANATAVSYGPTWTNFLDTHAITEIAWRKRVVTGCQDVDWLRERLVETCMISVDRDDVLDLPDRAFKHAKLNLHGKAADTYRYAQKHFLSWVEANFGDKAVERASKAEAIVRLMALWRLDGLAKVPATVDYIDGLCNEGEPVVAFGWHTGVVDGIAEGLTARGRKVRVIKGGVSPMEKAEIVALFQMGAIDVVVGQITSAGTGLTLTAARHAVFAQLPWSPGSFSQASDRIYRIGQKRKVVCHILAGADIDDQPMVSERMYNVIQAKAVECDVVNTGKTGVTIATNDSVIHEVLNSYGV